MIRIENLSQPYGLKNISCHIPEGKLVGIMGANGAGKSTLLKTLAGILPISKGEIWFQNNKLSEMTAAEKSQQLAYFAQNPHIHWDLSVYDVIALGLPKPLSDEKERSKISEISQQFSIEHLLNKPFSQLSGGEKARVQLARCCIKDTPLLLADEPIASLDPYYQLDMMEKLKFLTPTKTCVVVIHHLNLTYRFCDEIILLHQGNIIDYGKTQAVLNQENIARGFGVKVEIDQERKEIWGIEKLSTWLGI
ncbi:ABC transporter ATP-binding protein [Rodentibacter myodis]|uniref:Heme ABC transporter n=1 Tax=Rodentibacter myodis TaxID=1907939 RepID=A0A1V3JLS9_9PAST|nr:ABC transporter ATP-binding protein [Rodentibacter myodis]OOF57760.1 heme ABC transporter [Rodentibacter myodis]